MQGWQRSFFILGHFSQVFSREFFNTATIIVVTAGSTQIIEPNLAHLVHNIVGDKDWCSQICNGGKSAINSARNKGVPVEIIHQMETETGVGGHYFIQPEYQQRITEYLKDSVFGTYKIY